nr:hypothetical protein Iba_chr01aCG19610 [Ipomoea batatas]
MSVLVLSCGIGGGPGGSGGLIIGGGPKGGLGISGTITPGGGGWPTIPGGGLISVGGGGGGNREIPGSNISVCKVGIIAGPAGPGTKACCLGGGGGGGAILSRSSDPAGALESFSEDAPSDLDCDPGGGVHFHQYPVEEVEQNGGMVGVVVGGVTSEFLHVPLVGVQEEVVAKEVLAMMCPRGEGGGREAGKPPSSNSSIDDDPAPLDEASDNGILGPAKQNV